MDVFKTLQSEDIHRSSSSSGMSESFDHLATEASLEFMGRARDLGPFGLLPCFLAICEAVQVTSRLTMRRFLVV